MKKTLLKNTLRTIRKNFVSWLAISVVVMMCCGIYFGTFFYAQAMAKTVNSYASGTGFEDFNLIAVAGLKENELDQLRSIDGIADVEGTWRIANCGLRFQDREADVDVYGLTTRLSRAEILEGRLPERDGECALTGHVMEENGIALGDTVQLAYSGDAPEDLMKSDRFTVTARVNHPDCLSTQFGDLVFLAPDAFDMESVDDNYSCVRVAADLGLSADSSFEEYTAAMTSLRIRVREHLDSIGAEHDRVTREDANQELDEARAEADEKLGDAKNDIDEAEDKIEDAQGKIEDADQKVVEAEDKIADAEKKIADAEKKIARNEKKLKKAKKQLRSGKKKLKKLNKKLKSAKKQLSKAKKRLSGEEKKLQSAKRKLDKASGALNEKKAGAAKLRAAGLLSSADENKLKQAEKELKSQKKKYNAAKKKLASAKKLLAQQEKEYKKGKNALDKGRKLLKSKQKKLKKAEKKLKDGKQKLKEKKQELADKKQELTDKKQELADKKAELADARQELADGKQKYKDKKEETDEKIADAQQEIDDLKPSAYVFLTRDDMEGYVLMKDSAQNMRLLGGVFVVIFSAVGAVVVLSTVLILIDANKKLIGTMKSFGFRSGEIIFGYLIFAVTASFVGMLLSVGLALIIQLIISHTLGIQFIISPNSFNLDSKNYAVLFAVQLAIAAIVAVVGTVLNATRFSAISLMDGSAGKKKHKKEAKEQGTGSLYSRLILRNIRTDLARVITSIVIIGGSCLMMGAGVTLRDSLFNMMPQSAAEVTHYDAEVTVADRGDEEAYDAVRVCLEEQGLEFAEARKINTVFRSGETEYFVSVIAAPERLFPDYLETTDIKGKQQYHPTDHGILVSNRIADKTGLRAGDEMEIFDEDYQPHTVTVGAVCRNYLGRNLYFSEGDYQALFGKEPEYNTFLVRMERSARDTLREALKERFSGVSVEYTDELPDTLTGQCDIFNVTVYVMLALSVLMSVFVLLNLVNIFVNRRRNEVIIMAVNGFSWSEQIGYLLKETVATTVSGLLLGIAAGCALTEPLVRIVEGQDSMFVRSFNLRAWLFAAVAETVFALIINAISFRRLKKLKLTDITK